MSESTSDLSSDLDQDLPFGTFERIVEAIVALGGDKLSIHELSRVACVFLLRRGLGTVRIVVARFDARAPAAPQALLGRLLETARDMPLDLVLVGGGEQAREQLRRARPFFTPMRVGLLHVADDGTSWKQKTTAIDGLLLPLEQKLAQVTANAARWERLVAQSQESREQLAEHANELSAFGALIGQRKPIATWTLASVIGAVFGLQLYVAGADATVGLVRLGALVPARVADGEWWRLISCTFLHAGWMHVLLNTYVLLILGTFLERIIGPARFLVIYAASALAGSVGSYFFLRAGFSVGASGAVWGLLGAHAILAYRPQGLLPAALIPGARKAALFNLGLNVLNSFRPHVDMWAHFAGGAAGAALFASGLLTRSIPRLGDLERSDASRHTSLADVGRRIPTSGALWVAGALSALVLAGGLGTGIVAGRALELQSGVPATRQRLDKVGVSLLLPTRAAPKVSSSPRGPELVFGDLLSDPMVISVFSVSMPARLDARAVAREMDGLKKSLQTPPKTLQFGKPRTFTSRGDAGLTADYRYPSGVVLERAFLFRGTRVIRVEVVRWPRLPRAAPDGVARKIIESAEVL